MGFNSKDANEVFETRSWTAGLREQIRRLAEASPLKKKEVKEALTSR